MSTEKDMLYASVMHMLESANVLPCSAGAQAFQQLVQHSSRFQVALDALLPTVESAELPQRILASYILFSLYAPHPIAINPFKSALFSTFIKEREDAVRGESENEQLVWVLWKILKGDGCDMAPYSPSALAASGLPEKLKAGNLVLDEEYPPHPVEIPIVLPDTPSRTPDTSLSFERQVTQEEDERDEIIAQAMQLLLHGRERTLTLSEQRLLAPILPTLTSPPMIASSDLPSLISHNPTLAHPLIVGLLAHADTCPHLYNNNTPNNDALFTYLDVLKRIPPTLPSFDLLGRLLRDPTPLSNTTIADLVRIEVIGRFIHEAINFLDNAEREERAGMVSEDVFAKGVRDLCRFYSFLLKMSFVSSSADADSAEMAHFTLRNARFEEANSLYRQLAMGRF